ncbi:MAG TPA: metal-binding protein [Cyanobacteria bacterium UBA11372]|nr:metal-binding protein [Cyanobacteria bacterium UBA11372]
MEAIYIPHLLKAPKQTQVVQVDEFLPSLETLTPVRGQVRVTHQGTYLEVSALAEAIATLSCHRCLQQYNHRLVVNTSELIWLDAAANQPYTGPIEQEIDVDDLVETLAPDGVFNPGEWLYEQMCLALPQRQLCDRKCKGIQISQTSNSEPTLDQRWAALEVLKGQFPQT